jgi:NAD(P)-dependent dehydrogenase (short-subunit alcohol dehydrogenase family)
MKSVVVTGVSTGIGWGTAKVLTKRGFRVFGSVRKQADADRLSRELGANVVPLMFDVTDDAAVRAGAARVRELMQGEKLFGLVNNAGVAVPGPLAHLRIDDFRRQMDINLTSVLRVTQAFLPQLGMDTALKGEPGRIVNISSVGGKNGSPFIGAYAASKHALEGFSESLRRELMLFGIDVIIIGPGAVATPIWDKAGDSELAPFVNTPYGPALNAVRNYMVSLGRKGLPPERLGRLVHKTLTTPKPRVRYGITPNPVSGWIQDKMPKRFVDRMIAKRLGLVPASTK